MNIWMLYIYKTNIYGLHLNLWVKPMVPQLSDYNCAILLQGCAPQQNSTIAVTSGPIVLTRASHGRIYLYKVILVTVGKTKSVSFLTWTVRFMNIPFFFFTSQCKMLTLFDQLYKSYWRTIESADPWSDQFYEDWYQAQQSITCTTHGADWWTIHRLCCEIMRRPRRGVGLISRALL